jgi:acyl carrier protein
MRKKFLKIINRILEEDDKAILENIEDSISLRNDLGFDSLNLAKLTVIVEDEFGVDIFEDDIVDKVGEILDIINKKGN